MKSSLIPKDVEGQEELLNEYLINATGSDSIVQVKDFIIAAMGWNKESDGYKLIRVLLIVYYPIVKKALEDKEQYLEQEKEIDKNMQELCNMGLVSQMQYDEYKQDTELQSKINYVIMSIGVVLLGWVFYILVSKK